MGDLLLARRDGAGRYSVDTSHEFFDDAEGPGGSGQEASFGGVTLSEHGERTVATLWRPLPVEFGFHVGAVWLDNITGRVKGPADGRVLVDANSEQYGMGDIERLCAGAGTSTLTSTPMQGATPTSPPPSATDDGSMHIRSRIVLPAVVR